MLTFMHNYQICTLRAYRTVSIKRPGLIFFKKSLLNVPYDRKKEGLNILSYRSYNRMVRVSRLVNVVYERPP